jgi:probable phosphoglycerate mutase
MDQPIRRLILMRHGEVTYFDPDGRALDPWRVPLTERGQRQAHAAASAMAASGLNHIVTSAVPRSVETATILSERLKVDYQIDEAWNEVRPGALDALAGEALDDAILATYSRAAEPGARFFGGEAFADLTARVEAGLARLMDERSWTTVLVVTHDPVIRFTITRTLGLSLGGMRFFEQDPGCITIIDWVPDRDGIAEPVIRLLNSSPDDPGKHGSREPALVRFHRSYLASRQGAKR